MTYPIDPALDLILERTVDVPKELVWQAWTQPEYIKQWFTPAPWQTVGCEIDLRRGGLFHTTMRSPEGQEFPNAGCYLEVIPNEKLVFTNAFGPGYRPLRVDMPFTAMILLEDAGPGRTKYTAIAMHGDPDTYQKHADMGFHAGWGKALEQLVALFADRES